MPDELVGLTVTLGRVRVLIRLMATDITLELIPAQQVGHIT
jgi:hypothetical protein